MQDHVRAAAVEQGFEEAQAEMLAACARNIYAIGCQYHPNTITILQEICKRASSDGEPWALLLQRCISGQMGRLRSDESAVARLQAARSAAQRRRAA